MDTFNLSAGSGWRASRVFAEDAAASDADIEKLIVRLGDDDFQARNAAAAALRKSASRRSKKLRKATENPDIEIARTARKLLGKYEEIMGLLDKLPQDWHTTLYYDGLTETQLALVQHGAAVVPYIAKRLTTEKNPLYHSIASAFSISSIHRRASGAARVAQG